MSLATRIARLEARESSRTLKEFAAAIAGWTEEDIDRYLALVRDSGLEVVAKVTDTQRDRLLCGDDSFLSVEDRSALGLAVSLAGLKIENCLAMLSQVSRPAEQPF